MRRIRTFLHYLAHVGNTDDENGGEISKKQTWKHLLDFYMKKFSLLSSTTFKLQEPALKGKRFGVEVDLMMASLTLLS